ncbi:hypothetical protein, partial [Sphingobium jiangsuense]
LEIRHRSVRPISAKHAQASRFLQQSHLNCPNGQYDSCRGARPDTEIAGKVVKIGESSSRLYSPSRII